MALEKFNEGEAENNNKISHTQIENEEIYRFKQRKKNQVNEVINSYNKTVSDMQKLRKQIELMRKERTLYDLIFQKLESQICAEESNVLIFLHLNNRKKAELMADIKGYERKIDILRAESEIADTREKAESPRGLDTMRIENGLKTTRDSSVLANPNAFRNLTSMRPANGPRATLDLHPSTPDGMTKGGVTLSQQKEPQLTEEEKKKVKLGPSSFIHFKVAKGKTTIADREVKIDPREEVNLQEIRIDLLTKAITEFKLLTEENNIESILAFDLNSEEENEKMKDEIEALQREVVSLGHRIRATGKAVVRNRRTGRNFRRFPR